MKAIPAIFAFFLVSSSLFAQQSTIRGEASIINSQYETKTRQYVANAQVEEDFDRANAQITDVTGRFDLILKGVKEKESVTFNIKKDGLEVVNTDALSAVAGQKEVVKIYMATPQKIAEYKKQYYQIGKTNAEKGLEARLKKLQSERQTLLTDKNADYNRIRELETQLGQLEAQRAKIEETARELARRYAPINLDDASLLYQEAFSWFQKGELDQALGILQKANLAGQAQNILNERSKIAALQRDVTQRDSVQKQRTADVLSAMDLKADLHKSRFEFDSVVVCFELMLALDSTEYHNTFAFASFLAEQNQDQRAITLYQKCLTLATLPKQRAVLQNNLGILYENNNRMADAEKAYAEALSGYRVLAGQNPGTFLPDVAMTLHNAGAFYKTIQKLADSEKAYDEALLIRRKLAEQTPETYLPYVASTLNNLGLFYRDNKRMPEAEQAYKEALSIRRKLAAENPELYLPNLARTLNNMGGYYRISKKMPEAEQAYNEALGIFRKLAEQNPDAFLPAAAATLNNLGNYYRDIQKVPESEKAYLEALSIRQKLADQNPDAFLPDLAVTLKNLASLMGQENRYAEAVSFHKASIKIRENAVQAGQTYFTNDLVKQLGDLSWWAINARDYALADQAALRCLALDETQIWVWVNIGHARQLSGKEAEAREAWLHLKGKSEGDVSYAQILEGDWEMLESLSIAPAGTFDAARKWVKETW